MKQKLDRISVLRVAESAEKARLGLWRLRRAMCNEASLEPKTSHFRCPLNGYVVTPISTAHPD